MVHRVHLINGGIASAIKKFSLTMWLWLLQLYLGSTNATTCSVTKPSLFGRLVSSVCRVNCPSRFIYFMHKPFVSHHAHIYFRIKPKVKVKFSKFGIRLDYYLFFVLFCLFYYVFFYLYFDANSSSAADYHFAIQKNCCHQMKGSRIGSSLRLQRFGWS